MGEGFGNKEGYMRLSALIVGLFAASVVFTAGVTPVSAQSAEVQKNIIKIQSGDTLSGIAKKHSTTYVRIFDANTKIKDPDVIYAGSEIRIPHKDEKLKSRALPTNQSAPAPKPVTQKPITSNQPAPAPRQQVAKPAPVRQAPKPAPAPQNTNYSGVWDKLAMCESGGNWQINTGNGFYGGLQFTLSSWNAVGGNGYPHHASKSEQIARAEKLQAIQGWGAWPACSAKLGL